MNKNVTSKRLIITVIVTNLITAFVLVSFYSYYMNSFKVKNRIVTSAQYKLLSENGKMAKIKEYLKDYYVDNKKINDKNLFEGSLDGMVSSLGDIYTTYLNEKDYQDLTVQTEGSYVGVGLYIGDKNGKIIVLPIEDSPAEKAGIKSGDIIEKVNNIEVSTKDVDKAIAMMKGKEGRKVKITIYREGKGYLDFNVVAQKIEFKTVKSKMLANKIGYIRITTFSENTGDEFVKQLNALKKNEIKGLVLDLRDNPGGLLDQCQIVADELLGKGTIVYTINNKGEKEYLNSDAHKLGLPLTILVNGGTASASEIVSGAVRDHKAGTLIGTRTFGKGLVQTIIDLGDKTALKVTIARYYTPNGECIQKKGIKPDIVIQNPVVNGTTKLSALKDVQLQKAIEVIKAKIK